MSQNRSSSGDDSANNVVEANPDQIQRQPICRLLWPQARPQAILEEVTSEDSGCSDEEVAEEEPMVPLGSSEGGGDQAELEPEVPLEFSEEVSESEDDEEEAVVDENFAQQVAEDDFLMQARICIARCLSAIEIDGVILNEPDWYRWSIFSNYVRSVDRNIQTALRTSGERVFRF